jgi:7,8-dihydropterin-6-yl-methyl-4-(beta-D-ribofuranosyl)aminobenzene 5'-phosphate synthase
MIPMRRVVWIHVAVAFVLLFATIPRPSLHAARIPQANERPNGRISALNVVILSTMLADNKGIGEWGFAALVEVGGHRVLFDTGARPETVLRNARELGVDLSGVTDVILSHHHGDHTGGMLTLRRELAKTNPRSLSRAYVGPGIFLSRPRDDGSESNETIALKSSYEATGGAFVVVEKPTEVFPGAWLTGPVPRTHPERNWSGKTRIKTGDGLVEDTLPEDLSLVLDTERGLVVISGCGHAGIINTLEHARRTVRQAPVYAAIGGFHLFPADDSVLDWTAGKLRLMRVQHLLGAHCTGIEAVYALRQRLRLDRRTCVVGVVGAGFDLENGIRPGMIAH